jgi:hypothetical protein
VAYKLISHVISRVAAAAYLTIASLTALGHDQAQSAGSVSAVTHDAPSSDRVNGRRALLNTSAPGQSAMSHTAVKSLAPVAGAAALLEQSGVAVSAHSGSCCV